MVAGRMRRFNREAVWLQRAITQKPESFGELRRLRSTPGRIAGLSLRCTRAANGSDHWLLDGNSRRRCGDQSRLPPSRSPRFLTGLDVRRVVAHGRFDAPFYNGAESTASVLIEMENGASGVLHELPDLRNPHHEALYLFGEHGMAAQHAEAVGRYHGAFIFGSCCFQ